MKKTLLTLLLLFSSGLFCSAQQLKGEINSKGVKPISMNWLKDPFDQKAFIENRGQFDKRDGADGSKIQYGIFNMGTQFYFTPKGWTYRHDETRELTEEEIINEEHAYASAIAEGDMDKEHVRAKTISTFLEMNWEGANPDAQIIADDQLTTYFTYPDMNDKSGASGIKAPGYNKITYKNLYPGIDVEYTFPKDKRGIEYALIVHPGADPSVVKMHYSKASNIYIDANGDIQIETTFGNFVDHAPVGFYEDHTPVKSAFQLNSNTVSFNIDQFSIGQKGTQLKDQTLIIDPWTSDPLYTGWDAAYDINYDNAGNVYVYGGSYPWKEVKFNSLGAIVWTYTASILYPYGCSYSFTTSSSACYGDFAVDGSSGSSYIIEAFNYDTIGLAPKGTRVLKLNSSGSQIGMFTPSTINLNEMWRVQFNNCTKEAIIAGGGISQTYQACLLDTNVSTMTPVNVLSASSPYHDFTLLGIDNYGSCFMATNARADSALYPYLNNVLVKCPSSTLVPVNYTVADHHDFVEVSSVSYIQNVTSQANGFNGMAVDNNYVYTYDGSMLRRRYKSTGAIKDSVLSGGTAFASGGIDVNGCGDIFLGIGAFIYQIDSNYSIKNIYSAPGNVFDLQISSTTLYACGYGFVGTVNIASTSCGNLNVQATATPDTCSSKGTAKVSVSGGLGPYTYSWSPSGKTTSSITGLSAGSYTVTVIDQANTACNKVNGGTQTLVVTIPTGPLPSIGVSGVTGICSGTSTPLTASGGVSYTWSPSTGLSATTGTTVTANPTTTTTYTVVGTGANGCPGTTGVTVTVNPKPTITINPPSSVLCNGQSVSLTASGGVGYGWSPSTGLSGTSGPTVSANPTTTTTYSVIGTDANGCTNTGTVIVTINPRPTITVNPTAPILCNGQSVSLTAGGGNTYVWSPGTGLSATTGSPVSANPTSTTSYTVTGTDGNGCTNTAIATVTINPKPTISVSPPAPILCNGQFVSLTASGGTTYTWSPSTGLSATTGTTVSANPTTTTTYTVTGTNGNGCTNTTSVTVTINPKPTITVSPPAPILCNGQSVSLTASGGVSYAWSPSTGLSGTSGTTVSANPTGTTAYIVTGTDANGCTNTGSVTVTINPKPTITVNPSAPVLCNGQSVSLTASGGNAYIWSPGTGLSATSGSPVSANPSTTTSYTVTGTDGNGCTNTSSVTVTINPKPTINVNPSAPILCNGQSVSLTASGGNTYSWSPTTGLSSGSGATVSSNPTSTTAYTVTGTDGNGCTNTAGVTVTVNPKPTISVLPSAPVICNGQSVSLTASGGVSYVWSPSTGLSGTSGTTVSANPTSTTAYIVTGTDANGCTNTASETVTINPKPTITVNPSAPILCNGQSVSLTAGGGTTYVWSPGTGLSATSGATVSANPASTTSYTVTGTDGNGCTNTAIATVTINPKPTITVNPSATILCNGQSVSLTAGGGITYVWNPSTGLSSGVGTTVSADPTTTTSYTVTGTDGNGCTNTGTATVTINPKPTITVGPSGPILCNGQSVSLNAGGGNTYTWSPGTGLSATTGSTVSANPSSTTAYTITGTDGNGCTNTATVTVTVNPKPVITANPSSPSLCDGASVLLTAGGGVTYIWSPGTGLSATTGSTVSANPTTTTTYTINGTDANGCTNTATVTVTVNAQPTITVNPVTPILCNGNSLSLTAGGATTYVWSPGTGLSATTGATVSANPSSTTTYTVTGTESGGCSNTTTITVTVNPLPTVTVNPTAPILCNGQSVSLTAGGGNTYVWSPGAGLSATSGSTVSANPNSTTLYTVTGTDGNGCTNTASVTVTINPKPTITVNPSSPILCNGQSVSLTAGGGNTYVWSPTNGLSSGSGSTVSANPTTTSTYVVTGTDGNGCTNTGSVTVTINPLPVITASPTSTILCNGQSVTLNAGGGNTYVWTPSTGLSSGSGSTVSANPTTTTTYIVTGTDGNGCTNTASATVSINPKPSITANPVSPILCSGQSVSLTAGGGNTYVWSPSTGLSSGSGSTVSANPTSTTTYIVTGTDGNGCTNTASVTVTINPTPTITVSPSAPILCNGQSVLLTASGGNTYVWSPTTGLSSGSGLSVSANPSATTTYIVTGSDGNGCTSTGSVTVSVNPLPAVTVSPNAPVLCNGQSVSLTAGGGNTYVWNPTTGLSSGSGVTVSADPTTTSVYTVTGTDGNGCSNTASVTVTVNPLPVITVNPTAPAICNGQAVSLTASGGSTYTWSPTTGLSSGSGSIVSANPSSTTTYIVTGTNGNGCSSTSNVTVSVNTLPVISVNPDAPVLCNGQSVSLTASGANTYSWSPGTGLSSGTGTTVSADPSASTTYVVTGTDGNGCSSTSSVTVTVNPLPVVTVAPTAPAICIGQSVSLTASGGNTYSWNPTTGLSSGTGAIVSADPTGTMVYTVTGTDGNGCSSIASATVTVNPLPVVNAGPDANICPNDSAQLTVTGPPAGSTYTWTPSTNLSCSNCSNPYASPQSTTTYIVSVTTLAGCSAQDTVNVVVTPLAPVAGPDTAICNGVSVQLHASGGTSYQWTPTSTLSNPDISNPVATPSDTTVYTVTVSSGACSGTATVKIVVHPIVPTPTITQSGDTLFCSYNPVYSSYQWYYNDTIIPNATKTSYIAPKSGNYNVAVYDENGCSISVGINIIISGVGFQSFSDVSGFSLYPNPATNELFVDGYGPAEKGAITIFNMIGEMVQEEKIQQSNHTAFDISNLSSGIYFIRVELPHGEWVGRFVKE